MRRLHRVRALSLLLACALIPAALGHAQSGEVASELKISNLSGGLTGPLQNGDYFGCAVALLGDVDGDGIDDLAVGASGDDTVAPDRGAVYVLFLNNDGTVKGEVKIASFSGGFGEGLTSYDRFGYSVAALGDHDGDGTPDLAVGAFLDDDGGLYSYSDRGAVWLLFLNADGTVKIKQKISQWSGGLVGPLDDGDMFGCSVTALGDMDEDDIGELAVGARGDDDGGWDRGAVWILFMDVGGTVKREQKISLAAGGFMGPLAQTDDFGNSLSAIGDLNGDGVCDLAVGAWRDDDLDPWTWASDYGAVWILMLESTGMVLAQQKITRSQGGFGGTIDAGDFFGSSVTSLGDLDGDGIIDLAVGAIGDDDGWSSDVRAGAVWLLFMDTNGTVRSESKISQTEGGFVGSLEPYSYFGSSVGGFGDFNGDGHVDLLAGSIGDDDGGTLGDSSDCGALFELSLYGCPLASATLRNPDVGGHTNPDVYGVIALPIMGGTFTAAVVTTGKTGSFLMGYATPLSLSTPWGNALVDWTDPAGELLGGVFAIGDPAIFDLPVPDDPVLYGFFAATQAMRIGGGIDLTNAQDIVLGR